jgi:hypothetical protein
LDEENSVIEPPNITDPPAGWWTPLGTAAETAEAARVRKNTERRKAAAVLLGLALVLLSLGMLSRWLGRVRYPDRWDPKVASLAAQTEKLRGLKFKRPVYVQSVPAEKFDADDKAQKTGWIKDDFDSDDMVFRCGRSMFADAPCERDGKEVDPVGSLLRALGVIDAKSPAFGMPMSIDGSLVIARYDTERKRIEVRGSIDSVPKSVLVHELVHVLQDQNFGITCECRSLDPTLGYRSLIEGDATRIEEQFMATHRPEPSEVKAIEVLDADTTERVTTAREEESFDDATFDMRLAIAFFPYYEGRNFVVDLHKQGGQPAIDAAFRKPPQSSAEVFRRKVLSKPFSLPERLRQGAYNERPFPIGAWYWSEALRANGMEASIDTITSAWGAEAAVIYHQRSDRNVCFESRIALFGKNAPAAADALRKLSAKLTNGSFDNSYEAVDGYGNADYVLIGACDPVKPENRFTRGNLPAPDGLEVPETRP